MKLRLIAAISVSLLLVCAVSAFPQSPAQPLERQDVVAAGASYSDSGVPKAAGTLLYAHRVSDGLYSFTLVDIFARPVTVAPDAPAGTRNFVITTTTTTGVAQHMRDIGKVKIFAIGTVGAAAGGSNIGWAYSTGGAAYIGLGKGWCLIPNLRMMKSSLSDYQGIFGIMIGWGK